jgi:iron complex outermembrane receptor protein
MKIPTWRDEAHRLYRSAGALRTLLIGAFLSSAATAADQGVINEVVVTASRVQRDGFTAPTPTTVLGAAEIEAQGARNLSSVLFELPAMRPTQTNPLASQNSGSTYANLRGLGSDRTLVLVDGRRFVPNSSGGGVDTNVIPPITDQARRSRDRRRVGRLGL